MLRSSQPLAIALLLTMIAGGIAQEATALKVEFPAERAVFQRDVTGSGFIPVRGTCPDGATVVEAKAKAREGSGTSTEWVVVDAAPKAGHFSGRLPVVGGWYELAIRARAGEATVGEGRVARAGVGEVFVIVGHSVAHGGKYDLPGATDDRVSTVAMGLPDSEAVKRYETTADPEALPPATFVHFGDGVRPAPFGHGTYFWAQFAEAIAKRENVPVLFFNAAFGGTSLEHWSLSAQGKQFEHSFVRAKIGMPYVNLRNTLRRYAPITGLRAVLADQGQNDWPNPDENMVFGYYRTWVEQARKDLDFAGLPIVVNRQTPYHQRPAIRRAQERILREVPNCFPGPDYDLIPEDQFDDKVHFNAAGCKVAARVWTEALTPEFFKTAKPYLPKP
jgi:hypothetical protein